MNIISPSKIKMRSLHFLPAKHSQRKTCTSSYMGTSKMMSKTKTNKRSHLNMLNQSYAKTLSISLPHRLLIKSKIAIAQWLRVRFHSTQTGCRRQRQRWQQRFTNNAVNNGNILIFDYVARQQPHTILTKLPKRNKTNNFWITTIHCVRK